MKIVTLAVYRGTGSDFYCNLRQNNQMQEGERIKE